MAIEERVQIAIDNWAPRFIANGVDPNDFQRLAKRIERWGDWSREWSTCAAMHEQMGKEAEAQACYESAGYHYLHAAITYHFGKFVFVQNPQELLSAQRCTNRWAKRPRRKLATNRLVITISMLRSPTILANSSLCKTRRNCSRRTIVLCKPIKGHYPILIFRVNESLFPMNRAL